MTTKPHRLRAVLAFAFCAAATFPLAAWAEPFSIDGLLSHCDYTDTTIQCEIHADGARYVASSADGTSIETLETLFELGTNTPLRGKGEVLRAYSITRDVILDNWGPGKGDGAEKFRAALQGYWTDASDGTQGLLIHGSILEDMNAGIPTSQAIWQVAVSCADAGGEGPALRVTQYDTQSAQTGCWVIRDLSGTDMLLYLPEADVERRMVRQN